MKSTAVCPVSDKRINENIARTNALFTVLFLLVYLFTSNEILIISLLIDFLLRAFELSVYSPFAILSAKLVRFLNIKPKIVNAGPKLFAARIGAFFSLAILVTLIAGLDVAAYILTAVFGLCASLEGFFGYCIACLIYPWFYRVFYPALR
ncbi:MAG: CDP-alcohol phosphatidyltransferase [Bacteroidetes bacterium]|nr:CDP-alcohol phosphatidyltransferase [Bacteroidota bacterium]